MLSCYGLMGSRAMTRSDYEMLLNLTGRMPLSRGGRCLLCRRKAGSIEIGRRWEKHAKEHLDAVSTEARALQTLIGMRRTEPGHPGGSFSPSEYCDTFSEVFGFRPGSSEATMFWRSHPGPGVHQYPLRV